MTKVTVDQQFQNNQFLIVSRQDENETIVTSRIVISDENTNQIKIVNIEQGPQGTKGELVLKVLQVKMPISLMYCL